MKVTLLLLTFFLPFSFGLAQEIAVREQNKTLEGTEYRGYIGTVSGSLDVHRDLWLKQVKNKGKVRKKNSVYQIEDLVFSQITEKLMSGFTQILQEKDTTVSIWLGVDVASLEEGEDAKVLDEIKGMIYNYILDYRKSLVLKDIQDAERAASFTSRKHQRLIQDLETLQINLLDSENERKRLEESIKTIEFEIQVLKQKIENNKTDQETTYQDLEKIRKVLEMHKERLKKLN